MESTQSSTTEMGKVGERDVFEGQNKISEDQVPRVAQFICALGIGTSMKILIFVWLNNLKSRVR